MFSVEALFYLSHLSVMNTSHLYNVAFFGGSVYFCYFTVDFAGPGNEKLLVFVLRDLPHHSRAIFAFYIITKLLAHFSYMI